jgi:hypothetical protein
MQDLLFHVAVCLSTVRIKKRPEGYRTGCFMSLSVYDPPPNCFFPQITQYFEDINHTCTLTIANSTPRSIFEDWVGSFLVSVALQRYLHVPTSRVIAKLGGGGGGGCDTSSYKLNMFK